MSEQVVKDGRVVLRNVTTGVIGSVPLEQAEQFSSDPDYRVVDAAEYSEAKAHAEAQTLGAQAETFARGAGEAIGDLGQVGAKIASINPLNRIPMEIGKQLTGVDVLDMGRGLPAQLAGAIGAGADAEQEYAARTKLLREENPGSYGAGEFGANVIAGLATGGVTAAAGKTLAGALARTGLGEAAAGALGTGAAMAVEGGVYGAAQTEGQARDAGQTDGASAEQLLQGIGLGALLGGGLGVGMSAASSAFRKLVSKADEVLPPTLGLNADAHVIEGSGAGTAPTPSIRDVLEPSDPWGIGPPTHRTVPVEPGPGVQAAIADAAEVAPIGVAVERPLDKLAKLQHELMGGSQETISKYGAHVTTPEAIEGRQLWRRRAEIVDEAVPKMTESVDKLDEALNTVTDQLRQVQLKKEGVDVLLEGINHDKAFSYGSGQIAYTMQRIGTIRQLVPKNADTMSIVKRLESFENYVVRHMRDTIVQPGRRRPTATDVYMAGDMIKREAQHVEMNMTTYVRKGQNGNQVEAAKKVLASIETDVQEPLRMSLENEAVWGRAGKAQKEINAAWKADIDVSRRYESELMVTDRQKVWADGRDRWYADSGKVKAWMESIGTSAGLTRQRLVRERLDTARKLLGKIEEYHSITDDQRPVYDPAMQASHELEGHLAKLDKTVGVANEIETLHAAERVAAPITNPLASRVIGAVTGAVGAGPMGAAMGALGLLARPGAAMGVAEQVHALAGRLGLKTTGKAGNWVRSSATDATGASMVGVGSRVLQRVAVAGEAVTGGTARRVAVPAAVTLFQGRHKNLNDAYEARSNQLIRAQQDPSALIDNVARVTGGLSTAAPGLAGALVEKTSAAIGFLASKAPAGTLDPTALMPGRKAIVGRSEMAAFARVWAAVERPLTVLEDLQRGTATPDQVEALKVVHPETYQAIRVSVMDAVLDVAGRGGRIPIAVRQQLDMLLDLGGAGEPAFAPDVTDRIAALREQQPKQQTPSGAGGRVRKSPNLASAMELPQTKWLSAKG